jgi:hypothetical protein
MAYKITRFKVIPTEHGIEAPIKEAYAIPEKKKGKNEFLKQRSVDNPYEIWKSNDYQWTWRVLKKYQVDDDKPYARWFCAVKSPFSYGNWEYGDVYVKDIKQNAKKVSPADYGEDN